MIKIIKISILALFACNILEAQTVKKRTNVEYRKTQEVNFDAQDIDGVARTPSGSYLVQKRGVDFVPLYNLRQKFDDSIKESIDYLR